MVSKERISQLSGPSYPHWGGTCRSQFQMFLPSSRWPGSQPTLHTTITAGQAEASSQLQQTEISYCLQSGKKVASPTAHQQEMQLHHKVESATGKTVELLSTTGHLLHKPITL